MSEDKPVKEQAKFIVRMTDELRDEIKDYAVYNKRSMNAEIVARLEGYDTLKAATLSSIQKEMARIKRERDDAEARLKGGSALSLQDALKYSLPDGLYRRISQAATIKERSVAEEVVQALEAAFPAPKPFSLDQFNEEWIARILQAPETDRPTLIDEANQVLLDHGGVYEIWLEGPKDDRKSSSVILARRGAQRELSLSKTEK